MFCFGLQVDQVAELWRQGYRSQTFIERSPRLCEVVATLRSGLFSHDDAERFTAIVDELLHDDRFMVCADFDAYDAASELAASAYRDRLGWAKKALVNIATSPRFSSDETIAAYARDIWKLLPLTVDVARQLELLQDAPVPAHAHTFSQVGDLPPVVAEE
jgi:starch phosphorylase